MSEDNRKPDQPEHPATNTGEDPHSRSGNDVGRGGDTLVQDDIAMGRPLEGEEAPDIDRRAP